MHADLPEADNLSADVSVVSNNGVSSLPDLSPTTKTTSTVNTVETHQTHKGACMQLCLRCSSYLVVMLWKDLNLELIFSVQRGLQSDVSGGFKGGSDPSTCLVWPMTSSHHWFIHFWSPHDHLIICVLWLMCPGLFVCSCRCNSMVCLCVYSKPVGHAGSYVDPWAHLVWSDFLRADWCGTVAQMLQRLEVLTVFLWSIRDHWGKPIQRGKLI